MRLGVLSTLWVFWATQASCFYVQEQKPLGLEDADPAHFTLREQTDELCDAGSKYWTGTVNVTDQKSIFFCMQSFGRVRVSVADLGSTQGTLRAVMIQRPLR